MRKLLLIQATLIIVGMAASYHYYSDAGLLAAAYGGGTALVNTMLLSRRLDRAGEMAKSNPDAGVLTLYLGVVQRFVFVLIMFGFGMGAIHLLPPPLLGTFAVAQLAYMIFGTRHAKVEQINNS
ncbi:MAG: ATP synthase subunit I [Cocleimonas sp.]|nr:ATP synthase subunit I [Cocleimonas sp.]